MDTDTEGKRLKSFPTYPTGTPSGVARRCTRVIFWAMAPPRSRSLLQRRPSLSTISFLLLFSVLALSSLARSSAVDALPKELPRLQLTDTPGMPPRTLGKIGAPPVGPSCSCLPSPGCSSARALPLAEGTPAPLVGPW